MARTRLVPLFALGLAACNAQHAPPSGSTPSAKPEPVTAAPSTAPPAPPTDPAPRRTPGCAVQDCKTHQIVDDGCVDDGKGGRLCASCVNACP